MHPRIKERFLDTQLANRARLQAKMTQVVCNADKVVATHVAKLEKLLSTVNSVNEAGILKIPNEFTEHFSDTIRTLQQLDLNRIENLQLVDELLVKLNTDCTFLISHTKLQAATQNFDLLGHALAGLSEQQFSGSSVEAIGSINKTIDEMAQNSSAIAAAVKEQSAATQQVAKNITGVSDASKETDNIVTGVTVAAKSLSTESQSLKSRVDDFLVEVRAI